MMKKIAYKLVFLTFVLGSVAGLSSCSEMFPIHKGNGRLMTYEKSVSVFEKIDCEGSANVHFYASDEYRTVITVDSNLEEFAEVFTKNNTLHIRPKRGYSCIFTKFLVEVYCPTVTEVSLSGSCDFSGKSKIVTPSLETTISGSGKMIGTVECDSFSGKISGSGKIAIDGVAKDANIVISGSGKFDGADFNIKDAIVKISGSGDANIWVDDILKVNISGSGRINYRGEPEINSSISGSGRIRRM